MPEFMQKKLAHKTQKMLKSVEKGSQKGLLFRTGSVFKIMKIRDIFKMGPRASKMSPWPPKSSQNGSQNGGTVAGYALSALDIGKI